VSLATHGWMTRQWQNSARRRRCHARYRVRLIVLLGWAPEGVAASDRYAATTGELRAWAHEKYPRRRSSGAVLTVRPEQPIMPEEVVS
jgi:hypothetical protein